MEDKVMELFENFVENNPTETCYKDEISEEVNNEQEEKYNELYDKYLRQVAEYDNFRKRTLKEKEELRLVGHRKAIETILPVIDDFERALINISEEAKEGVNLIYKKFISSLQTLGVEKIEIENNVTIFDTDVHDAVTMVNVTNENLDKVIIDCVQSGYMLNGKIIRHPKVIVGNYENNN